jgi:hypothetical protein
MGRSSWIRSSEMIEVPEVEVCIPSYGRPVVETLKIVPWASVYVDPREEWAYIEGNPGANIVACDEGVQGSAPRVRNWIMDRVLERGNAVCLMDDDVQDFGFWEDQEKHALRGREEWEEFLSRGCLLAMEFGAKMWGVNLSPDIQNYRQYTPFSLSSPVLGPFSVVLPGCEVRRDEGLVLKDDYDYFIQHMNEYRKVLRVNRFYYQNRMAEQVGGVAKSRSLSRERKEFDFLVQKWGSSIVMTDRSRNGAKSSRRAFDYNPIVKIPIRGV